MLMKPRVLLKYNMKLYLDQTFIREGNYDNVISGQLAFDGVTDLSQLQIVEDAEDLAEMGFNGAAAIGRVFQSPFKNWVYQSGLQHSVDRGETQKDDPILASGVWVNGVFKPHVSTMTGYDPTLFPTIDWMNGRILMSSGLTSSDIVQSEYSFMHVMVQMANRHNLDLEEYVKNSRFGMNPDAGGSIQYPSGRFNPLPAVFIEITDQSHDGAHELGNRSLIERDQMRFFVASNNEVIMDNIADTIRLQDRRTMPVVDFNVAPTPLSGFLGQRSPDYIRYDILQGNVVAHPSGFSSLYGQAQFQNARVVLGDLPFVESAQVTLDLETYIILPDGPIGTSSIGFNFFQVDP